MIIEYNTDTVELLTKKIYKTSKKAMKTQI